MPAQPLFACNCLSLLLQSSRFVKAQEVPMHAPLLLLLYTKRCHGRRQLPQTITSVRSVKPQSSARATRR